MAFRILVAEDDRSIANLITVTLSMKQYDVTVANDGIQAADLIHTVAFDLILLDIMLPGIDGYALLELVKKKQKPAIFISAKAELTDRVYGLNQGAEDYITKPFEPLELLARVETALRRVKPMQTKLVLGSIIMDTSCHTVIKDGKQVDLTKLEYDLFELLMKNSNMVFSREQLLDRIWGYDYMGGTRTVDMHIKNLRSKLDLSKTICTIHKIGYKLSGNVEFKDE